MKGVKIPKRMIKFLKKSLDRFTRSIPKSLLELFNTNEVWEKKIYPKLDDLLMSSFPYLVIKEEEPS